MNRAALVRWSCAVLLAGGAQASAAGRGVVWVDCDRAAIPAAVHPTTIVLACGDGNAQLVDLTWIGWGAATTVARGEAALNDCTPSCVGGKFHRFPVRVKLERIRPCGGLRQYTRRTIFYVGRPFPSGPRRISEFRGCAHPA